MERKRERERERERGGVHDDNKLCTSAHASCKTIDTLDALLAPTHPANTRLPPPPGLGGGGGGGTNHECKVEISKVNA